MRMGGNLELNLGLLMRDYNEDIEVDVPDDYRDLR